MPDLPETAKLRGYLERLESHLHYGRHPQGSDRVWDDTRAVLLARVNAQSVLALAEQFERQSAPVYERCPGCHGARTIVANPSKAVSVFMNCSLCGGAGLVRV